MDIDCKADINPDTGLPHIMDNLKPAQTTTYVTESTDTTVK